MLELYCIVHGHVQGVNFRWTVQDTAWRYGLTGTVGNLDNGTVEIVAQGDQNSLEAFLHELEQDPGEAIITEVDLNYREAREIFAEFTILS